MTFSNPKNERNRNDVYFLATRHHQFRVNMSKDNEFLGVAQDNPELITYIREVHLTPAVEPHHRPLETAGPLLTDDTSFILKLLNNKVSFRTT